MESFISAQILLKNNANIPKYIRNVIYNEKDVIGELALNKYVNDLITNIEYNMENLTSKFNMKIYFYLLDKNLVCKLNHNPFSTLFFKKILLLGDSNILEFPNLLKHPLKKLGKRYEYFFSLLENIIHNKHNSIDYSSTKMIGEYDPFNRLFLFFSIETLLRYVNNYALYKSIGIHISNLGKNNQTIATNFFIEILNTSKLLNITINIQNIIDCLSKEMLEIIINNYLL